MYSNHSREWPNSTHSAPGYTPNVNEIDQRTAELLMTQQMLEASFA